MTNNSIKVLVLGLIALLLTYFNKAYSILIMLVLILIYVVNAYQLEKHYQRMGRFLQRERDNELKEVEIENKYHEKILSQLIRSMNLPMLFVDKEGKIAFTNQSFRKGFEIPHLKGRYYKDIFVGEMLDLVEQCYVFERPLSTVVKIQSRYYQVESSPVFSDHEKLIFDGTIVLFTDVSKMKEIEDMQKQFLSDVSHELKTPMSAIIGSVEILKRDGMESPEIFNEFMDILLKESYRMQNIINDILELSRLDQTKVSLDYQELDVKAVVKESMDLFEPLAKDKHLSMVYQTKVSKELMLDYATVKTILNNLVSNAIKYSNSGVISIKAFNDKDKLTLIVQDEGIGISKDDIPLIYDRFFQVDRSRSKKLGTGLGLSIVKRMVELNNGSISVESDQGIGSVFTVVLPILCE